MDCIVNAVAKSWTRLSDLHNSTSSQLSCGNNNTDVIEIVKIYEVSTCLSVVEWKAVQSFYKLGCIYIFCLGEEFIVRKHAYVSMGEPNESMILLLSSRQHMCMYMQNQLCLF